MVDLSVKMRIFDFGLEWLGATLDPTDALAPRTLPEDTSGRKRLPLGRSISSRLRDDRFLISMFLR